MANISLPEDQLKYLPGGNRPPRRFQQRVRASGSKAIDSFKIITPMITATRLMTKVSSSVSLPRAKLLKQVARMAPRHAGHSERCATGRCDVAPPVGSAQPDTSRRPTSAFSIARSSAANEERKRQAPCDTIPRRLSQRSKTPDQAGHNRHVLCIRVRRLRTEKHPRHAVRPWTSNAKIIDSFETIPLIIPATSLETKVSSSVSLPRAKLLKHHKLGPAIQTAANQHDACVALGKEIITFMKGTKYPLSACVVDAMGKEDFKATVTLARGAAEFDASKFKLALGVI